MMEPVYVAISWILLTWHTVWEAVIPGGGYFLATNWEWILAIVFLVITVRIVLFPIFVKQIRSQRAMQALQPRMKALQAQYKNDPQTLRQEMMKLYQSEKVNPLMGCLPMLLQIPVFFGLFHVLKWLNPYDANGNPIPDSAKTLYGWSVEKFDSAAVSRLFDAPIPARFADTAGQLMLLDANGVTVKVVAGTLVLMMMVTTFLTSRQMILKTGWNAEPQQRMIQKLMLYGIPISLLLSGWYFPIGVIIYWVVQNIVSLGQQYWVLHKYPPPVNETSTPVRPGRDGAPPSNTLGAKVGRFLRGEPINLPKPPPRPGTVQPARRTGLFRRRTAELPPAPETGSERNLAPRPGAKPGAKSTPKAAEPPASTNGGQSNAAGSNAAGSNAAGSNGAKPTMAASGGEQANGQKPAGEKPAGQKSTGGQKSGGQKSGGQRSGAKKTAAARKGPANKRGGSKR